MEDRVAEDRMGVVVEAHEAREIETLGVVHAEHDPVDERVEEEAGEERQRRAEEQEVDRAFSRASRRARARSRRACGPWSLLRVSPGPSQRRERDPTGRTILAPAGGPTYPSARSTRSPSGAWIIRRATAAGTACSVAATCSSSAPSSPRAARWHRCSPRAPRRVPSASGAPQPDLEPPGGSAWPDHGPDRRRRSERRAGTQEGLRRLQGSAPCGRVGHPGARRPGPGMGSARARHHRVGRAGRARRCSMACSFERGPVTVCWRTSAPIPGWPPCSPACPTVSISAGLGEATTRAFPLALSRGVQTTGLYYNKALLDQAGLEAPTTIADLKAMVKPLSALGAAPLVHCSGDVSFNPLLVMWVLPMIAERTGDPLDFVERTIKGEIRYDSPEWTEAFQTIADLRTSGVLLDGSGATDYATMQLLLLQGKAAMTYNGSWLLAPLQAGTPTVPFDLHVAPLPLVDETLEGSLDPVLRRGFALPADGRREPGERVCLPRVREPARSRPGGRRGPAVVLADRRLERRDPRPGGPGVPADVRGRDHVAQLALGAGDRRSRSATRSRPS